MREVYGFLYDVSLGVWIASLFIAGCYDNVVPMWISLVIMNIFYVLKEAPSNKR